LRSLTLGAEPWCRSLVRPLCWRSCMKSRRDFFVCSRSRLFKFSPWADAGASSGRTHVKPKKQRGLRPANHRDAAAPPSCRGVQPQVRPIRMTMICIGGLRRRTSSLHPYSSRWCPRLHAAFLNVLFAIGAARHCMTSLTCTSRTGRRTSRCKAEPNRKADWSRNQGTRRFHATWIERLGSLGASSMAS